MHARKLSAVVALIAGLGISAVTMAVPAVAQDAQIAANTVDVADSTEAGADLDAEGFDQFVVSYKQPEMAAQAAQAVTEELEKKGTETVEVAETGTGDTVVKANRKLSAEEAEEFIAAAEADPEIEYIELDRRADINALPTDPYYKHQWGLHDRWDIQQDGAFEDFPNRGENEVIALVDNGLTSHPDIDGNVIGGYDFVRSTYTSRDGDGRDSDPTDEGDWHAAGECGREKARSSTWHGTHAAGIMAATANDGVGIAGVAPEAKILNVRVLGKCGGNMSDIADGIIWASGGYVPGAPTNPNPAKTINLSLGGKGTCTRTYQNAINIAVNNGASVVVSAGNNADEAAISSPGNCDNVIVVGATSDEGTLARYSNFGDVVDVMAPGGDTDIGPGILSSVNSGKETPEGYMWRRYEGTSMAAPFVSGIVAWARSMDPTLTPAEMEQLLKDTAYEPAADGGCEEAGCGAGIADMHHIGIKLNEKLNPGEQPTTSAAEPTTSEAPAPTTSVAPTTTTEAKPTTTAPTTAPAPETPAPPRDTPWWWEWFYRIFR